MKHILRFLLYLFLIVFFNISLLKKHCYGQDILALNYGEKIKVSIISISKEHITFYKWEDLDGKVIKLNRKRIKWYRPESWTKERFSFSFSFGGVPYGTSTSLKKFMKDNGYQGRTTTWWGNSIDYPKSNVKIPWMLEFEYNFKPPHGIALVYAAANNGSVTGYSRYQKVYPEVHYENPQLLVFYKHYSKSFRSNFQAGFLINFCSFSTVENANKSYKKSKIDFGLMVGFAVSIIEKDIFFLRFQSQFKYVPPIKFSGEIGLLANEEIGLSSLFLGIQTGFKIYPVKK